MKRGSSILLQLLSQAGYKIVEIEMFNEFRYFSTISMQKMGEDSDYKITGRDITNIILNNQNISSSPETPDIKFITDQLDRLEEITPKINFIIHRDIKFIWYV